MNPTLSRLVRAAMVAAPMVLPAAALSQQQAASPNSFISIAPVFEEADLDRGGQVDLQGVILRGGTSREFGAGHRGGITLNYDYIDYDFDNPVAFGGVAPWGTVQRYGFSLPFSFALRDGWSVGVAPSFDWFKEDGAKTSDSLIWGATFTGVKRFGEGQFLGLGVGVFDRLEETSVFPFPIVNWRFSKHWRLINPLAAGPTGPAGLELDYLLDNGWEVGVGAAIRRTRFRLDETGPTPNGIGEVRGVPVFLRASKTFAMSYTLNLYVGAVAGGELTVEDASGNELQKEDYDLAPMVGFNVTARF